VCWQWLLIRFRAKNQNYIKSRLLKSYHTVHARTTFTVKKINTKQKMSFKVALSFPHIYPIKLFRNTCTPNEHMSHMYSYICGGDYSEICPGSCYYRPRFSRGMHWWHKAHAQAQAHAHANFICPTRKLLSDSTIITYKPGSCYYRPLFCRDMRTKRTYKPPHLLIYLPRSCSEICWGSYCKEIL
jgi:hypothetical protein